MCTDELRMDYVKLISGQTYGPPYSGHNIYLCKLILNLHVWLNSELYFFDILYREKEYSIKGNEYFSFYRYISERIKIIIITMNILLLYLFEIFSLFCNKFSARCWIHCVTWWIGVTMLGITMRIWRIILHVPKRY